jgi:hypothetical protein
MQTRSEASSAPTPSDAPVAACNSRGGCAFNCRVTLRESKSNHQQLVPILQPPYERRANKDRSELYRAKIHDRIQIREWICKDFPAIGYRVDGFS